MLDLDWAVILTLLTALAELFNGWLCGLMDKASDFGSEDCRFESCHSRKGMGSFLRAPRLGHEESDMPELLHFHFSLSCIREGNGNPLHCFYLENPRNGGVWWAAVYGVAQSRTRLKRLSSSSSSSVCMSTSLSQLSHPLLPHPQRLFWGKVCIHITSCHFSLGAMFPGASAKKVRNYPWPVTNPLGQNKFMCLCADLCTLTRD